MSRTARLLAELIALPSVNPAFLPPEDPRTGERRMAEFVAATAGAAGLEAELQEVLPDRPNVLARLSPGRRAQRRLLLAPHLDTVGGDSDHVFQPRRRLGRLHGRGACDTKGGVAAMLTALMRVARSGRRPQQTEIVFAGLVDEENGQAGSRALAASGFTADLAIVGEPTRLQVVTAHKGDLWLQLETRGRAAHGSRPELGDNAIHRMACVVELLETTYAAALRPRRHRLLGQPTISVGTIQGGKQPNIVPDRCVISLDRRTLPGETDAGVRQEIRRLLKRHRLRARMLDLRGAPCPPLETDPRLPLVRQFMACLGQRRPLGAQYFCDAAVLACAGTPSVVFGPGDIAQAHTADEWISLRQLDRAAALLEEFIRSLP
jgi:succinyl-diaminopimelate desuccinylase